MSLDEASGHHHPADLAAFLSLDRVPQDRERFLSARFEEPTGVHDDRIGGGVAGNDLHARFAKRAEHAFAVDEVLRAAETDERDG